MLNVRSGAVSYALHSPPRKWNACADWRDKRSLSIWRRRLLAPISPDCTKFVTIGAIWRRRRQRTHFYYQHYVTATKIVKLRHLGRIIGANWRQKCQKHHRLAPLPPTHLHILHLSGIIHQSVRYNLLSSTLYFYIRCIFLTLTKPKP